MGSTHGRKALPLPDALLVGLRGLGMIQVESLEPATFRHPSRPDLIVTVNRSNLPGSDDVLWAMRGNVPQFLLLTHRTSPDALIARAKEVLHG